MILVIAMTVNVVTVLIVTGSVVVVFDGVAGI